MTEPLVRLAGIVRRFGAIEALSGADLELFPGEVHGVLGENGAGKSTLLGILGGMHRPDEGRVFVDGLQVALNRPRDAWHHGIGLVHQHFTLVPPLNVLENLALGRRTAAGGLRLPYERVRQAAASATAATGLEVDLDAKVESLSVGERQRVEILKALMRSPRILVLDEPTAVLTPGEVASLFQLVRRLAVEGCAVVLVAHKLDEVLSVADRVTVLRRGRTTLTAPIGDTDASALVAAMVGVSDDVLPPSRFMPAAPGEPRPSLSEPDPVPNGPERGPGMRERGQRTPERAPVAALDRVRVRAPTGSWALADVSLRVWRGEIVGIAGVEGNGQHALATLLAGLRDPEEGMAALPDRIGFVPQDRTTQGLIGDFDLIENTALGLIDRRGPARRGPFIRWGVVRERAEEMRRRYSIQAPGVKTRARTLSGGNQQRLVVGRELDRAKDLLVAENPTRGLDIRATRFVHDQLRGLASSSQGPGVVLISTDLDEILALAHRVYTLVRGRLNEVPEAARSKSGVGALMLRGDDAAS